VDYLQTGQVLLQPPVEYSFKHVQYRMIGAENQQ
jgi:hypothetical protein